MKLGIMQPYFFPYIGYFQLMSAVDSFVVYDNIEFTKKGWINRNRYLSNGEGQLFSLPLKKDSDYLDVKDRQLADTFNAEKEKIKRKIGAAYAKAPHFDEAYGVFAECMDYRSENLFDFIYFSISRLNEFLGINTELIVSSAIREPTELSGQDRVLHICEEIGADHYINPIGGTELYDKAVFRQHHLELSFLKAGPTVYEQFGGEFVPNLSILDVIMFNPAEKVNGYLQNYEII